MLFTELYPNFTSEEVTLTVQDVKFGKQKLRVDFVVVLVLLHR